MRRRDFTIGLLLAVAVGTALAQETAKQHRIAIIAAGAVARIRDPDTPVFPTFFNELRQLGDVEGENLTIDAYSGEGRSGGYAELAREVVNRNPDVIVALGDAIARAARAANGTMPIVWIGADPIEARFGRAWRARAATSPGSPFTREPRSGGSASRSSRKQSLRCPRLRTWICARS